MHLAGVAQEGRVHAPGGHGPRGMSVCLVVVAYAGAGLCKWPSGLTWGVSEHAVGAAGTVAQ